MLIRTTTPTGAPYDFTLATAKQCTWYSYYRAFELFGEYPTYNNKATKSGKYPNANKWLLNNRENWEVKPQSYTPVPGDIVVFDGSYGHVAVVEYVNGKGAILSQYNMYSKKTFSIINWDIGQPMKDYTGKIITGKCLGYLHYKYNIPKVETETLPPIKDKIGSIISELEEVYYEI